MSHDTYDFFADFKHQLIHGNHHHFPNYGHGLYDVEYNDTLDYNTNAKSYYDYLAKRNRLLSLMAELINRLLARDLDVKDTSTVDLTKLGNWIDNGSCTVDDVKKYEDILTIKANVIFSKEKTSDHLNGKTYTLDNATKDINGVYTPNYMEVLKDVFKEIKDVKDDIKTVYEKLTNDINAIDKKINNNDKMLKELQHDNHALRNAMQRLLNNLNNSGAVTSTDVGTYQFRPNSHIATGNMNLFTNHKAGYIRTNMKDNDYIDLYANGMDKKGG